MRKFTLLKIMSVIIALIAIQGKGWSQTYYNLSSGTFTQDWSNTGMITTDNTWTGVASIIGYGGNDYIAGTTAGVDPQTVLNEGGATGLTLNVKANQTTPNTYASGGLAEFEISNPVVAFQGSGTADAPNLVIFLNTTGVTSIKVKYNLRDIDGSTDNAIQPVALQFRVGTSGDYTNIPAAFVADASTGPSLADLVTAVDVTLPTACENQSQLQLRIITANAVGSDEFIGIDDINISGTTGGTLSAGSPTIAPSSGNNINPLTVTITPAAGTTVYYTTNGNEPTNASTLYSAPFIVSNTTTVKAIAYETGKNPSSVTTATYTFPTNVANIAALRAAPLGFYKLTGEAVLTFKTTTRNAKYIQDATGAVLIDDASAKVTTSYNLGDGISGIIGTTAFFNSMLQFTPVADPGAPTSTGKTVTPLDLTLTDLINHQAELVKVSGVTISDIDAGTGSFDVSKSYNLNGATNPVLRTQYADLNYIGQTIPTAAQDIIGVVLVNGTTAQLVPRSMADMVSTGLSTAKQNLKLFAANGKINFEAAEGETVEVYNTVGQKVLSAAAISGNNSLAINAKGVVFVKVGNRTGKVIL